MVTPIFLSAAFVWVLLKYSVVLERISLARAVCVAPPVVATVAAVVVMGNDVDVAATVAAAAPLVATDGATPVAVFAAAVAARRFALTDHPEYWPLAAGAAVLSAALHVLRVVRRARGTRRP